MMRSHHPRFASSIVAALLAGLASFAAGCLGTADEPCDGDACDPGDAPQENVGEAEQPLGTVDVGVIPSGLSCPAGSELIRIHMDDEDTSNGNYHLGWIGATQSGSNTTFAFCRVDGHLFRPLQSTSRYAVLKLGSYCPNGSHEFTRVIDNEDNSNDNWATGSIYPNLSSNDPSKTTLRFCLFQGGSETMSAFPNLAPGFMYGVFAVGAPEGIGHGSVYTDDEDINNGNQYYTNFYTPPSVLAEAQSIISSGPNTLFNILRVR